MAVLLFMLCGFAGFAIGWLLCGIWWGFALLTGLPTPTPDQAQGLVIMLACLGALGSAGTAAAVVWFEG